METAQRTAVLILVLLGTATVARADVPADLAESGDSMVAAGYPAVQSGYTLTSMFEPGSRTAVGRITTDDVDALAKVVAALKQNKCYKLWVRPRAKAKSVSDALSKCDSVYIVSHGVKTPPGISLGGASGAKPPVLPPNPTAPFVWIGSCYGATNAAALNGQPGATGAYHSMPKDQFDKDTDEASLSSMVQGLTAELKKLDAKEPCDPRKICILGGIQGVSK